MKNQFFNAHHAPIGAFSSFTLGLPGAKGGLGVELGAPSNQEIYIGLETSERGVFEALPFYDILTEEAQNEAARYDVEIDEDNSHPKLRSASIKAFDQSEIHREFSSSRDAWRAGDLEFVIYSPVCPVPDPESCSTEELKRVIVPAVLAEMTIDNTKGKTRRRAYFGFNAIAPKMPLREIGGEKVGYRGIAQAKQIAVVTSAKESVVGQAFALETLLETSVAENEIFGLGESGAIIASVEAGEKKTLRFAICFHQASGVTTGIDASYYYTRFFPTLESVASYALSHFTELKKEWLGFENILRQSELSGSQKFMIAHSVRSYYGSTQLLDFEDKPFWIVNEGEYRMINTFDLTVDQLFFEMEMNPWTVRNELDMFAKRYSYTDKVYFPNDPSTLYDGGISFTHDMGVANQFTAPGRSCYEQAKLTGCFSFMTHEELVNWLCCALVYGERDIDWLRSQKELIEKCFESMLNRDHPDPKKRTGVMKLDSSRCLGGSEITTYDSLDTSLGQARGNVYMAGKCWAVYIGLERAFKRLGLGERSQEAALQALRCETSLIGAVEKNGTLPAIIGEGVDARIIPVIEGLIFPALMGAPEAVEIGGAHGKLIQVLKTHIERVLKPGVCLFPDGAWKLSSTSNNSWMSKIYLCQHIARAILDVDPQALSPRADEAHMNWLIDPQNAYWCWSDQMVSGIARGSKYYPRGVTSWLWLTENKNWAIESDTKRSSQTAQPSFQTA